MSRKIKILIICAILIILIVVGIIAINKANLFGKKATKVEVANGITVVPTMNDTITSDSRMKKKNIQI